MPHYVAGFLIQKATGGNFLGTVDVDADDVDQAYEKMVSLVRKGYGKDSYITVGPISILEGKIVPLYGDDDG